MFISVLLIGGSVWLLALKKRTKTKQISQMTSMVAVKFEFIRYSKHSEEGDYFLSFRREGGS